jgi:hypothetical protein
VTSTAFAWAHANWDNAARLDILRSGWGEGQTGSGDSALGTRRRVACETRENPVRRTEDWQPSLTHGPGGFQAAPYSPRWGRVQRRKRWDRNSPATMFQSRTSHPAGLLRQGLPR